MTDDRPAWSFPDDPEVDGLADQPIAALRPADPAPTADQLAVQLLRLQRQLARHRREWRAHVEVLHNKIDHASARPPVPERLTRRLNALVIIVGGLVLLSWEEAIAALNDLGIPANASVAIAAMSWAAWQVFGCRLPGVGDRDRAEDDRLPGRRIAGRGGDG